MLRVVPLRKTHRYSNFLRISGIFVYPVFAICYGPRMRVSLPFLLSVFCLFFGSSCVRTSTVVKVKKDGTGTIVSRYFFSPQMLAMIDQLGGIAGAQGGAEGGPNLGMIREMATPDEESLRKDAVHFGEGVRYSKHDPGKDEDGWEGYSVVYEFDDIRKVRIDQNSVPGKAKEFVESSGEELKADKGGELSFALDGDLLTVKTSFASAGMNGLIDGKQFDQAREMGMAPSEAVKMAAGMAEGMRIGLFLRADGGIAETTAEHVKGDLIILSDADIAKVLPDPDFGAFIDKAAEHPEGVTAESVKALFKSIEAMTIESADQITVKFK